MSDNRMRFITKDVLSLVEYTKNDDRILYENWLDADTQKGFNFALKKSFDEFENRENRWYFFAMIQFCETGEIIGAVGISSPDTDADLAIWLFRPFRKRGYGTAAFKLATEYATETLGITELHAGAYPDNFASMKTLQKCGYVPNPKGNVVEKHYITGENIIQLDFVFAHKNGG